MPYISLKMTQPVQTFILTRDLHFNRIKITDVTCDINGFAPLLTNVLLQLNEYNENHFIFADPKKIPETVEPITVQKSSKAVVVVHKRSEERL